MLRDQPFTVRYFQTGSRGQGRIRIELEEVERIREALRVTTRLARQRRLPNKPQNFPGIHVPLGRPR